MRHEQIKIPHDSRGMTLVELLMVMAILSVVMMAVMSLYIPMHQSTVAQTQVSDVQSNLRLAADRMTKDLMTAGFLVPNDPIVFPGALPDYKTPTLTDIGSQNFSDFIIRTRAVGSGFARVSAVGYNSAVSPTIFHLTVPDAEMVNNFPSGSKVRIFGAMNGEELIEIIDETVSSVNRVFPTTVVDATTIDIDVAAAGLSLTERTALKENLKEAVMIRIKDEDQPVLQTIRYRLNNGALERIVNDSVQYLARNVDAVDFRYNFTPQNRVNRVDITLTGKTRALKNDAISGEKTREVKTSVRLRNVY